MDFKKLLLKIKQKVLLTNYSKEQEAEFDISKNKIVCFLPNVSVFDNTIKAKIGELIWVSFFLLTTNMKKVNKYSNKIEKINAFHYNITGVIKEIDGGRAIINCGFPVLVEVPASLKVMVGDFVSTEGRLDAYLVNNK